MRGEKKQKKLVNIFLVFLLFLPLRGEAKRGFFVEDGESPLRFSRREKGGHGKCAWKR